MYCSAPRKEKEKTGRSSLRSSSIAKPVLSAKPVPELEKGAKILSEWFDVKKVTRLWILMNWRSEAGLSHVASVQHRAMQRFLVADNRMHQSVVATGVSPEEFQAAVKSRHEIGSNGIVGPDDTKPL